VFWLRVVNNFLLAKEVLNQIELVANCDMCGEEKESVKHLLLDCTVAKLLWNQTKVLSGIKIPPLHPLNWALDLIDQRIVLARDATVILCGMWSLWMARNNRCHVREPLPIKIMIQWAVDIAFDLWQMTHQEKKEGPQANQKR
jgi:hypothetical protein